jgi:hypothetical protein
MHVEPTDFRTDPGGNLTASVVSNLPEATRVRVVLFRLQDNGDVDYQAAETEAKVDQTSDGRRGFTVTFTVPEHLIGRWEIIVNTGGLGPSVTDGDKAFDAACGGDFHRMELQHNPQGKSALAQGGATFWDLVLDMLQDGSEAPPS